MINHQVEIAILGAGTAGLAAYKAVKEHTQSVMLIDAGARGTTCARVGCMPSKLLIAAADAAHHSRHSGLFGVHNVETRVDGVAVMQRVQAERDRFVGFVTRSMDSYPANHFKAAYAHFLAPNVLQLSDGDQVTFKSAIIATGSTPVIPPLFKAVQSKILTNETVFDLPNLPKKIAVFGPGVIGLELGQALHRLGVDIKLFGLSGALGALKDPLVKSYALKHFSEEFYLDVEAKIESIEMDESTGQVAMIYHQHDGQKIRELFENVLVATGRRANLASLKLENSGLKLDEKGVPLFDPYSLQCGHSPIFIAGDVNQDRPLLHEAADEGRIAGDNAVRYPNILQGLRRAPLAIVFSDPQIAVVGLNLEQVKARCGAFFGVGQVSFEDQGRSRVMGVNKGLLRVYAELGPGIFLGAEMIGPRAEHLAHLLSWAVQQKMTVQQMLEMPFYHPVIEEGVRTALRDLKLNLDMMALPVEA